MSNIKIKLLLFLSVLGPSVITTMAGNDGGGVITYSVAGAKIGYPILIILPFVTLLYATTQEIGSRIAIATGKGLGDLIRERYGVRVALVIFVTLMIANFGSILTNVAAIKASAELFNLPVFPILAASIIFSFLLITRTTYEKSQRVFLTSIIFYFAYVFSAVKSHPQWGEAVTHLFVPDTSIFSKEFLITAVAVLGTTITPWGQFFVQSYVKDKNIPVERVAFVKLESFLGAFIANFFTFMIIVATAATLHKFSIPITTGQEAAQAIRPFAGELSSVLFGVGLLNAAIIGMIIISISSAYAYTEFFGYEGTLDAPFEKSRTFYTIFLFNLLLSGILVLTPWISLFQIVIYTQSLNAVLLPLFFFFLLKFANDKGLMGNLVNSTTSNYIATISSIIIILTSVLAVVSSLIGL